MMMFGESTNSASMTMRNDEPLYVKLKLGVVVWSPPADKKINKSSYVVVDRN